MRPVRRADDDLAARAHLGLVLGGVLGVALLERVAPPPLVEPVVLVAVAVAVAVAAAHAEFALALLLGCRRPARLPLSLDLHHLAVDLLGGGFRHRRVGGGRGALLRGVEGVTHHVQPHPTAGERETACDHDGIPFAGAAALGRASPRVAGLVLLVDRPAQLRGGGGTLGCAAARAASHLRGL